jgi:hypothetical protein
MVDDNSGFEHTRAVAVFADVRRLNVDRAFSDCGGAVMAAHAIAYDARVVENGGYPSCRAMAIVALIARRYMR